MSARPGVYVAGSSAEVMRAWVLMGRLREAGWRVTSTWPDVLAEVGVANPDAPRSERRRWALADRTQVERADVLWLLVPAAKSEGAYWELGYAHARRKLCITSGVRDGRSIFGALADHEFEVDEDALEYLEGRRLLRDAGVVF